MAWKNIANNLKPKESPLIKKLINSIQINKGNNQYGTFLGTKINKILKRNLSIAINKLPIKTIKEIVKEKNNIDVKEKVYTTKPIQFNNTTKKLSYLNE